MKLGRGTAWVFDGMLDIDWHLMSIDRAYEILAKLGPGATPEAQAKEFANHLLTNVDPDFPKKVRPGDYVVGGEGMGYGHAHSHAILAMKGAGIRAILCDAPHTTFKRDCMHHGFPLIGIRGIRAATNPGDQLEVDLKAGVVRNLTSGKEVRFPPYPDFLIDMLQKGGLYALWSHY